MIYSARWEGGQTMKKGDLSTTQPQDGHFDSPNDVENGLNKGFTNDLKTSKNNQKIRFYSLIIFITLLCSAVIGGSVFLIVNHINKLNATTATPTITTNIFNTNGTFNGAGVTALLNAVGYTANPNDTGTYTAHNIATRGTDNSGSTIIFPMGYVNGTSGDPLYWQATYLHNNYLTIWLDKAYTTSKFYSSFITENYNNYESSVIRDYMDNTFYGILTQNSTLLQSLFQLPSTVAYQSYASGTTAASGDSYYTSYTNSNSSRVSRFNFMPTSIYQNSYMWLPSVAEVWNNSTTSNATNSDTDFTGQWGLNKTDRAFVKETYLDSSVTTDNTWLRGTYWYSAIYAMPNPMLNIMHNSPLLAETVYSEEQAYIYAGGGVGAYFGSVSYGVRPATHISLPLLSNYTSVTVTLDQQGGSGGTTSVEASFGSAMPSITIPTLKGYTFGGYYTSTGGGGTQYYTSTGTSANNYPDSDGPTTLYAKWTGNTYYIKYNANGGSGTMENSTHIYGTSSSLSLNTFTREGYDFAGWAVSATGTKAYSDGGKVTRATSTNGGIYNLYALWTEASRVITLATNNSEMGDVSGGGTFVYGTEQTFYACPISGCGFMYWIDDNGNTYTSNPLTLTITTDMTLTAIFLNGILDGLAVVAEIGGEARINGFNESDAVIHLSAVANAGYTFSGWYIYGESTAISTEWSVDLARDMVEGKVIVARFIDLNNENINTDTNNTENLT